MALTASRELTAQTARVAARVETALRGVAQATAQRVQAGAQARVSVRTGETQRAIVVVEEADKKQFRVQVNDVPGRNPMVPVWLEFGTSKMSARPFMGPAADAERAQYARDGDAACQRVLTETA